jgi:hypothetical protein
MEKECVLCQAQLENEKKIENRNKIYLITKIWYLPFNVS